ncbi:MAG TPA: LacI family transcriptional regulator [Clostridiales bacterium]|nr:LacI family transcriptional regulator [Clostridiales bacterium]
MASTIKDIAKEAGVSITTVSLVLNNKECRVSPETREKILETARNLNYNPNSSARALVTKKTNTLGLIIPDINNPFFSGLAKAIEAEAQAHNYSIIFCNSDEKGAKDVSNLSLLVSKQIDGLIISTSLRNSDLEHINQFNRIVYESKIPVVAIDRQIPFKNYDYVSIDHMEGGFLATKHLLELGHKKIGCITGPLESTSAQERYNGYLNALSMFGVKPDPELVYHGDYQLEAGLKGAEILINKGVSAIFACNDMMACGAYRQARLMGKTIGKDLSIVGYDNISICEILEQPLTTIAQPISAVGKNACRLLLELINEPQHRIQNIKFLPTLIVRNTTSRSEA